MTYSAIREAVFLSRPNRFVAEIRLDGKVQLCHVKNTGRCRELLIPGARVWVQEQSAPSRKTKFDLITVEKGRRLVNIDSQAPNKAVAQWLPHSGLYRKLTAVRPEHRFGDSRLDFYLEGDGRSGLMEVKGVTLERDGVALFPDAPTLRGVRHLRELSAAAGQGWDAFVLFLIQMKGVSFMAPNWQTHAAFGRALTAAQAAGVQILALDCHVAPDSISPGDWVPVDLSPPPGGMGGNFAF